MSFPDFLNENIYAVSIALFIFGLILKQTPKVKNWTIPYILTALGVISCSIILGFNINSIVQGVIAAGVAVYFHQLGKCCNKFVKTKSDDNDVNNDPWGIYSIIFENAKIIKIVPDIIDINLDDKLFFSKILFPKNRPVDKNKNCSIPTNTGVKRDLYPAIE